MVFVSWKVKSLDVVEINLNIVTNQLGSHHVLNIWATKNQN